MNKLRLLICLIALAALGKLNAQELSYGYYNYIMNRYNLNPAFAGNDSNVTAVLNTKTYMSGFGDAPRNTMFGVHMPLNREQGVGARIISDRRGAYELTKYDLTYSYQIKFDEQSDLRFGISAGAIRRMLNPNLIDNIGFLDETDPTLSAGYYDETNFIAGFGMVYDYGNLQIGFSTPHLVIGGEELSQHMVGSASYRYEFENSDFAVQPIIIYQSLPVIDNRIDMLLKGEYKERVWAQVGYQSTENLNFALGFDFGPFGVGYSYEMNNSELSNVASNNNEIILRLRFVPIKEKEKSDVLQTLEQYEKKFDAMLASGSNYQRSEVIAEIKKIQSSLSTLKQSNDKKTAKKIEKKLQVIEKQIIDLEQKYSN